MYTLRKCKTYARVKKKNKSKYKSNEEIIRKQWPWSRYSCHDDSLKILEGRKFNKWVTRVDQ